MLQKGAYLKTNSHDNIVMPLLGLVWLNARINELHKFIEYSLRVY